MVEQLLEVTVNIHLPNWQVLWDKIEDGDRY